MVQLHRAVQAPSEAKLKVRKLHAREDNRRVGLIKDRVLRVQVFRKALNLVNGVHLQIKDKYGGRLLANHHFSKVSI